MLDQFRSLGFKLTAYYVLIFGLIQVILWTVGLTRNSFAAHRRL